MGNPKWSRILAESLEQYVGEAAKNEIMAGCEQLAEPDEKARAQWIKQAMEKLETIASEWGQSVEELIESVGNA